jgi:3-oxoacyl-[acyl-carrier protein] reductase
MKTVVVTGVTGGLGIASAGRLLHEGYRVVGVGRQINDAIERLISEHAEQMHFESFDFNEIRKISALAKHIINTCGPIYGLVNNAALGHDGVLPTMHESEISELIRVNIEAPVLFTKYISRSMICRQEGRIINVGSVIGHTGYSGLSVYGATKAAMEGFSRSLARELGKLKITVNTLAPGYMETKMTAGLEGKKLDSVKRRCALGELATVDDAAAMIAYLLSDDAKRITGSTLTVDAGSTA